MDMAIIYTMVCFFISGTPPQSDVMADMVLLGIVPPPVHMPSSVLVCLHYVQKRKSMPRLINKLST